MTDTAVTTADDNAAEDSAHDVAYSYRPSLLGAAWTFRLTAGGMVWQAGRRNGLTPYRAIRQIRLSYKPVSMQSQRFLTEIWADGAPKLEIVSSSWKSMMEQERQDKPYAVFVAALHRHVAEVAGQGQPPVSYVQGSLPLLYWPGLAVFGGVSLGLAWLTVRALESKASAGAAFIGAFMLLFLWQGGNFFRRNKPGIYSPESLPAGLMPKS
ncbi:MAG: hypothetical protein GC182_19275 [Rhodopseudomonas sp.]|nr:hypothetical protein [Rhodopseudomonas sp.]